MLCVSGAYVVMRYLSICPSTCPSCSCILSKWINISSIFSPSGSQTILVFPYQTLWQYSDGGIECTWGRKIAILSQYLSSSHAVNYSTIKCNTHTAALNRGELVTLVTGKRHRVVHGRRKTKCLWQKPQCYAKTTEQNLIVYSTWSPSN